MFTVALLLATVVDSRTLTLERIYSDPPLDGRAPVQLKLSPGGKVLSFLKPNEKDSEILDLWGTRLPDGKAELLVSTESLLGGKEQKLTEQEKMALERKRISKRGITSYAWCGADASSLIFPLSGDLYYAKLGDNGAKPTTARLTNDEDAPELDPICSKDGKSIAYVKKGEVFVLDVKSKKARQLTKGASATRSFGLAEFIAAEEMGRTNGMWWSPDGKKLLVFEVDESPVGVKVRPQIFSDRTELVEQRYPAAGEKNAAVTAWLVDAASGRKTKLLTPTEDGYLPRAGFFPDGAGWIQWQSRDQTGLKLFEANAKGALRQILEERDDAWVELHDDLHPLEDGKRFLWSTDSSGRRQIVLVDRASGKVTPLTNEPEPVEQLLAVNEDAGLVYFLGRRDRGRQLHVFSQPLAGGPATQISKGDPWHSARFDDAGRFYVDKSSDFGKPPVTVLRDATGKEILVIDANPASELASFDKSQPQWLDLVAEDGTTTLNGILLPPTKMQNGKKYPVIVDVYGGPTGQDAYRGWQRSYPLWLHWTQRGFAVFTVDVRGMAGRDRAFARAHKNRFNDVEVKDLFAAVTQLKKTPWVDGSRIGVFGWSYGGTLAARSVLDEKTPFATAASVAPVTDWTLYDTHYTERYIGVPDGGRAPTYASSNLTTRASLLRTPLLLVHGTADDNVLFENSLRLIEALQNENKRFDLMIYPGKAHGISGRQAQLHVFSTITAFFERTLK